MGILLNIGLFFLVISSVLSLLMMVYTLIKGKKTHLLFSFIFCQFLILVWSIGQMLSVLSYDFTSRWIFTAVVYSSVCFVGVSWFKFCLLYIDNKIAHSLKIYLFFIPPAVFYIFMLTNKYHYLFFSEVHFDKVIWGPIFWAQTFEVYVYCLVGTFLLVKFALKQMGNARKQSVLLILAVSFPLLSNFSFISLVTILNIKNPIFDITPISFSISLTLFIIATFKYRLLNIGPIAIRKIVDNMKEAVIIIDSSNKINNFNNSLISILPEHTHIKCNNEVALFTDILRDNYKNTSQSESILNAIEFGTDKLVSGEIVIRNIEEKCFITNVQPIYSGRREIIGRIVSFNDISEYKNLMSELNEKNFELSVLIDQLKEYAATVEELAVIKERNRFARDVHDTLGHTLTLLIALLEESRIRYLNETEKAEEKLGEAILIAREGLRELRRSITGLAPENLKENDLIKALEKLIGDFRHSGVNVEFIVDGIKSFFNPVYSDVVYRLCQESLTNAVRHGKAKHIVIILKLVENKMKVFISDNGIGCKNINKGYGLTGMEQRIRNLDGSIEYYSDGENGFNVRVEIPVQIISQSQVQLNN